MINIAEMPKYQTYKDSTEGWIGDVPEHWDIRKLKHLFYEKKHRPNMILNSGAISFGKVVTKDDEKILLSTKASYQEVLSGEFLINPLNLNYDLISLRIALSEIDVVVSAGYIVIKEKEELQKQYFKYLLHRYDVAYMKLLGSGVRQTISFNHIANSLLVFPPLEEQSLIANYLEKKTAQVDEAIAIKEQQISLLKERKQIIIQQAVTQGLDPNVPMKDTGVDWVGKIPAHWEVLPLTKYSTRVDYRGKTPEKVELGRFLLTAKNIKNGYIDYDASKEYIREEQYEKVMSRGKPRIGDLLFTTEAPLGSTALVDDTSVAIAQRLILFRLSRRFVSGYVNLYMQTTMFQNFLQKLGTGSTALGIKASKFCFLKLVTPPEKEQLSIFQFSEKVSNETNSAIAVLQQQIDKLKEYKTTLINSAVTGKIKITPEMVEQ